jgi:hypothetical protein
MPDGGRGRRTFIVRDNNDQQLAYVCFKEAKAVIGSVELYVAAMSALPPKADIVHGGGNVRFVPKADSCTAAKSSFAFRYHRGLYRSEMLPTVSAPRDVYYRVAHSRPSQKAQTFSVELRCPSLGRILPDFR